MKKLFLGAAIAISSLSFAQTFGLKAGVNVASISDEGFDDSKAKVGFNAGAFANIPVAESFSIQPEVLYNQLGSELKRTYNENNYVSSKVNLDYITVPIMFQYKLVPQFYLEAGPEFGFLVSAKNKNTVVINGNSSTSESSDFKDDLNSFNFGVGLGAGFDITKNFGVNARYVAGFSDVTKPESDPSTDAKNKNNNFQAGVYFKF